MICSTSHLLCPTQQFIFSSNLLRQVFGGLWRIALNEDLEDAQVDGNTNCNNSSRLVVRLDKQHGETVRSTYRVTYAVCNVSFTF